MYIGADQTPLYVRIISLSLEVMGVVSIVDHRKFFAYTYLLGVDDRREFVSIKMNVRKNLQTFLVYVSIKKFMLFTRA